MKHSHTCPKCRGNAILTIPGKAGAYGSGNNIPYGATIFSYIPVDRFVCGRCGYSEEWIRQEDLETLKKKYN